MPGTKLQPTGKDPIITIYNYFNIICIKLVTQMKKTLKNLKFRRFT